MSNLPPVTASEVAAWVLASAVLIVALVLHLLPGLLAGLLVYELVHMLAPVLQRRLSSERAKLLTVAALAVLITGAVTVAIFSLVAFLRSDAGSLPGLLKKLAEIIESSRATLPRGVAEHLPANAEDLKIAIVSWLRTHAADVQLAGKQTGRAVAHILFGLIIGAMVSLHEGRPLHAYRPLARALLERAGRLGTSFRRIVFAQIRISALNTAFTAIYLMVALPLLGIDLPLKKTLVVVTFIAGLLPVVGNLISNTAIVIVSLSHSLGVAVASLVFLVVIHKLEYFLNARIVSSRIKARAWEVLLAMLVMEAAFGLIGVVAAPIYYGYLKDELAARELI
ncbi:MAG: AI-2E family transporter [Rhodocyclaceae bacterium]|jgi:predicted PurR-regulated permease PerM